MAGTEAKGLLTPEGEQEIVNAILEAERQTSGEIRVHLEAGSGGDPLERAKELFYQLKMDNTRNNNGVLFYVAARDHKFAIYGDRGMNKVVPPGFWDDTRDLLAAHFRKGQFKEGLVAAILKAGEELKTHFPWKPGDTDELRNEVSRG